VGGQLSEALTTATRRLDIDDTPMRRALFLQRPVWTLAVFEKRMSFGQA